MAAAIIVSSMLMPFQTVGAYGVHHEETELSNLFALFSPFPPVECLSWLECKDLLPILFHADDCPAVLECEQEVTEETEKQFSAISVSSR